MEEMDSITIPDPVYGEIILDPVANQVIQTTYFQRLKKIRQLGFVYKIAQQKEIEIRGVSPEECEWADHRRYDHCIGTYHAAKKFLYHLEQNSNIQILPFHKLCVSLAGLLHDIGHGPFSHFWEHCYNLEYKHENVSKSLIDRIFAGIELSENAREHEFGVRLIKSLIVGSENPAEEFPDVPGFLFEIINNKNSGIDVDKWDYMKRDFVHCKDFLKENEQDIDEIQQNINSIDNLFSNATVSDDQKHINYDYRRCRGLFELRQLFHRKLYRLPEVEFLNEIIAESLRLSSKNADGVLKMISRFGGKLKNIKAEDDEFENLTDDEVISFLNECENSEIRKYMECFNNLSFEEVDHMQNGYDVEVEIEIPDAREKLYRAGAILVQNQTRGNTYYFRIQNN